MPVIKREKAMIELAGVSLPVSMGMIFTAWVSAGGRFSTIRHNGSPYQVPNGFELVLLSISAIQVGSGQSNVTLGVGDTSVTDSAAAPAGLSYLIPNAIAIEAVAGRKNTQALFCKISQLKFGFIEVTNSPSSCSLLGYLVKV